MGLFGIKMKAMDATISDANKEKMKQLFHQVVQDNEGYEVIYGYSESIKTSNYILAKKTTYTYTSLIIGFRSSDNSIVMLQTTPELDGCSDPEMFSPANLKKAKIVQGFFTLYHEGGIMAKYTQFAVTGQNDGNYLAYIDQTEEMDKWDAFWVPFVKAVKEA